MIEEQNPRRLDLSENIRSSDEVSFINKEDILNELFGDVGELLRDYSCAVESSGILLHGRMFITERFSCFYSNLFGLGLICSYISAYRQEMLYY